MTSEGSNNKMEPELIVDSPEMAKKNLFVRLFNGDVSLAITYWVFGGLIGGVGITLLNAALEANYMRVALLPYGAFIIYSFYLVALGYVIFIWIAIWRSAGKYKGSGWGVAARVVVVLGVLSTISQFMIAFDQGTDDELLEATRLINNSLPIMIDDNTRLESAIFTMSEYRYQNTVIDRTVGEINVALFKFQLEISIANEICNTKDMRADLETGVRYVYSYKDLLGDHITEVAITADDCP